MSTLKLDTLSNKAGTASVPSDTIVSGTAKAWVNFNGTGTVAIRRAFNVSSITDNGTGNYTVTFTNALSDTNYSTIGSSTVAGSTNYASNNTAFGDQAGSYGTKTTTQVQVYNYSTGGWIDPAEISVAIFS